MTTLYYTKDHEWINAASPESAVVGITAHAQDALGDVVFIELPEVGSQFAQGSVAGVIESVKAAADLYMPVTGEVVAVNKALLDDPSLANSAPLDTGWCFKIKMTNPEELTQLMDSTAYDALLKNS
jgi:glycine cleavage system H protein